MQEAELENDKYDQIRVDIQFKANLKKAFPDKSFRKATAELNNILEEIIYGKQRPVKNKEQDYETEQER